MGEGIHEGEIVRWRVNVGDSVKEDQPLVEVETAKAIVELPSPKTGVILARFGKEGEVIHVGDKLVVIGEPGEKYDATLAAEEKKSPGVVGSIPTEMKGVVLPSRTNVPAPMSAQSKVLPRVRMLAQQLAVDLTNIAGSGPGGEILEDDVRRAQAPGAARVNFEKFGPIEKVVLKGVRKAVAAGMVGSLAIPHVTHIDEFDASALIKKRTAEKAAAQKQGIKLTYLAYVVHTCAQLLLKHPSFNAAFDSDSIVYKKYVHVGIAVDTPEGLMVPVVKDADKKDVFAIAREITELAEKCRERKVTPRELEGVSFTITNIGSIGGIAATPIIGLGQSAILGLMRMRDEPVAIEGKIEIRPIMKLALSYDHRVLDGADAARFMNELIQKLSQ